MVPRKLRRQDSVLLLVKVNGFYIVKFETDMIKIFQITSNAVSLLYLYPDLPDFSPCTIFLENT